MCVCVIVGIQASWKHSRGDPAPRAACLAACVRTYMRVLCLSFVFLFLPRPSLSCSVWLTPACVSVCAGPGGRIWRSCGHSLRTWRVSLRCAFCNAASARRSGRTSRCSRPRCICMAFPLEKEGGKQFLFLWWFHSTPPSVMHQAYYSLMKYS